MTPISLRQSRKEFRHACEIRCQSCNAPTRMLIPRSKIAEATRLARRTAEETIAGDPSVEGTHIGPLSSKAQFDKVQSMIRKGIEEGAEADCGWHWAA